MNTLTQATNIRGAHDSWELDDPLDSQTTEADRARPGPENQKPRITPARLGLPAKFAEFRPQQLEAIELILATNKRFVMLQGPTGTGKTLIIAAVQRQSGERFLYICTTKQLQTQFMGDFAYDRDGQEYAVELRGRANYQTLRYPHLFPRVNASMCTSQKEIHCRYCCDGSCNPDGLTDASGNELCLAKTRCPYRTQKAKAIAADLTVVNTALFLSEANFVGQLSGWSWLVIDECDKLQSDLSSHLETVITKRLVDRLGLNPPVCKTKAEAWIDWAESAALPAVIDELAVLQNRYGVEDMRRQQELESVRSKLEFFLKEVATSKWVFVPGDERWVFKPVFVSRYAEHHVWRHGDRFILMSATIISPDELADSLGIDEAEIEFIDLPSTFPPENRPIYYLPKANITKRTEAEERPKAIAALDEILAQHPTGNVLVHTVSHSYAQQVYRMSRHRSRMITYDCAQDRESKLQEFKTAPPGTVLVASSMDRGVDLPDDQCRVIVIMKVPFLNLADKQVSSRLHADRKQGQLWYNVAAIRTTIQMTGRAIRSAEDRCVTYILDAQFGRLYTHNRHLFPGWWSKALIMPSVDGSTKRLPKRRRP